MEFSNLTYDLLDWNLTYTDTPLVIGEENDLGVWESLYIVLVVLIVVSNIWLLIVIVVTKELRRKFFYSKVLMCVFGDLLLCICLNFTHIVAKQDFWKSDISCQVIIFYLQTYVIYIQFVLASLLLQPILTYGTKVCGLSKFASRLINVVFVVFPFVFAFGIYLPISTTIIDVSFWVGYASSGCIVSDGGRQNSSNDFFLAESFLNIIIIIPAFICLMVFACIQRAKKPNTSSKGIVFKMQPPTESSSEKKPILDTIDESCNEAGNECENSYIMSIMAMTAFTWICGTPYCIFRIYEITSSLSYSEWDIFVFRLLIIVYYIPVAGRPWFWLINSDMRVAIKSLFQTIKYKCQGRQAL